MVLMLAAVLHWSGCGGSSEPPSNTETPPAADTAAALSAAPVETPPAEPAAITPAPSRPSGGQTASGNREKPPGNQMASGDQGAGAPAERTFTVPAGTQIKGELEGPLSSKTNKTGDTFRLVVTEPIKVESMDVIPRGTVINGTVASVTPAGRVSKKASMDLRFDSITLVSGRTLSLDASTAVEGVEDTTGDATVQGESKTARNAAIIAGGAAAGALAGKLLGKDTKDAVIGAAAGGAAGAAATMILKGGEVDLKAGSPLALKLNKDLSVPVRAASGSNVAGGGK
jgi:hypothetical protein